MLQDEGAQLAFFSPLRDACLPPGIAGIYLGGGYPERHARELSLNRGMLWGILDFAHAGGVVYAECGGLMYLSQGIQVEAGGQVHSMVGLLPFSTSLAERRMSMGYTLVHTMPGCNLFPPGATVRGQLYHFSQIIHSGPAETQAGSTGDCAAEGAGMDAVGSTGDCAAGGAGVDAVGETAADGHKRDADAAPNRPGSSASAGGASPTCHDPESRPVGSTAIQDSATSDGDNDVATCGVATCNSSSGVAACGVTEQRTLGNSPGGDGADEARHLSNKVEVGAVEVAASCNSVTHGYSVTLQVPGSPQAQPEGFMYRNVLASYVHLHFGSCPAFAASLVAKCREVADTVTTLAPI